MSLAPSSSNTLSLPARSSARTAVQAGAASGAGSATIAPGCVSSTDILRGQKAVEISHNGATYRLQATRLGKLILTK